MKSFKQKILAAKVAVALSLSLSCTTVDAGIPVIDAVGLVQHVMNAIQSIQQTMQMIESYTTQLKQLENQIKNTLNPSSFLWDEADNIINELLAQMDTIEHYKTKYGSVDSYLGKFKNLENYRDAPCLSAGCSKEDMADFIAAERAQSEMRSETVKKANDSMMKGLDKQQEELIADASKLRDLQANAVTAEGQLEAIQHANQLASSQANQLLQIRGLMISQQSAIAASSQATADEEALKKAAGEKLREGRYTKSAPKTWGL